MNASWGADVQDVVFHYGQRQALAGVSLQVARGEIFALLGPNGSGKTTLFRLLSTIAPVQQGHVRVAGCDCGSDPWGVRKRIGIVFQSPSLDPRLTVGENLACQAALYGLRGDAYAARRQAVLTDLKLADRIDDRCQTLSGGLKRRVELAKGLLHQPEVLLLDEPSTGLDPSARLDLWSALERLRQQGVTIILTTHLLEEADKADRIAIMANGKIIALGKPETLRSTLGGEVISIATDQPQRVIEVGRTLGLDATEVGRSVRLRRSVDHGGDGSEVAPATLVPELARQLGSAMQSLTLGQPSLEDVFVAKTGQVFE
jgi:ABC-2 type transport system ATP-binding protein